MNNYEMYNINNVDNNNILTSLNNYKKDINFLYNDLSEIKPFDEVPDKLYKDEFMEQDIEIDISSNKFRSIFNNYISEYNKNNRNIENTSENKNEFITVDEVTNDNYIEKLDDFYIKAKELNDFLIKFNNEKELLDLTKKELEQEKEMLNIEKEQFNKDRIKFQNLVDDIKNKIETILN